MISNIDKRFSIQNKTLLTLVFLLTSILIIFTMSFSQGADVTITNSTTGGLNSTIVNQANNEDTVILEQGTYKNNVTNIVIDKNLTIKGNGQSNQIIIDAGKIGTIFSITSGNKLTLINLTLTNGNSTYGGSINNKGTFEVINCTFMNSNATTGGVIYNNASNNIDIINSVFIDNSANNGAVIYNTGSNLNIINSTFRNNRATNGGSIYNTGNNITIRDSKFENNSADGGGSIYISGGTNFTIENSIFTNNNGVRNGGVIYNTRSYLKVINSTFTNNKVSASNSNGGVIYNTGTYLNIIDSKFTNNSGNSSGGVIHNTAAYFTLMNSTFINNTAKTEGIIRNVGGANFTVSNSKFINNKAGQGAAIASMTTGLVILNSTFINNTAEGIGGALICSNTIIENSTFANNTATSHGGAIFNAVGYLTVINSNLTNNTAIAGGGGAIISDSSGYNHVFNITNSQFVNNNAISGGAIYTLDSNSIITNSSFVENIAEMNGGAIFNPYLNNSKLNINGTNFTGNKATEGSAIVTANNLLFHKNIFSYNTATEGRTVPYKYAGISAFEGNLFNNAMGDNEYYNNTETFNTTLNIVSVEIIGGKWIIRIQANDTYNGGIVANGTEISLVVNGNVYKNLTDSNGIAIFTIDTIFKNQINMTSYINTTNYLLGNNTFYDYLYSEDNRKNNKTIINMNLSKDTIKIGEVVTISALLTDENGNPINNTEVYFYLNGNLIGKNYTNENGKAYLNYKSNITGKLSIENIFNGDMTYSYSANTTDLNVLKNDTNIDLKLSGNKKVGQNIKLTAKLSYNPPLPGQKVIFRNNGRIIGENMTDTNGIATLNFKFTNSGNYRFSAEYLGNSYYNPSNANLTSINLVKNNNTAPNPTETTDENITNNTNTNPNEPIDNNNKNSLITENTNSAKAEMKTTGIPVISILLMLLASLGIMYKKND